MVGVDLILLVGGVISSVIIFVGALRPRPHLNIKDQASTAGSTMELEKELENDIPIVFVGPSASGKTTALLLLHTFSIDHQDEAQIDSYLPLIRTEGFELFSEANRLVKMGIPPNPTSPGLKDLKVELQYEFKSTTVSREKKIGFIKKKVVKEEATVPGKKFRVIFADMSGEISSKVTRALPNLGVMTPNQIVKELQNLGLESSEVDYLVRSLFRAKGIVLVADASKIDTVQEDPDGKLANYMTTLVTYLERHHAPPKAVGLMLTKFDKWSLEFPSPTPAELNRFTDDNLHQTKNYIKALRAKYDTKSAIFYSSLREKKDEKTGDLRFLVGLDDKDRRRIEYSNDQYKNMLLWLKDAFGA